MRRFSQTSLTSEAMLQAIRELLTEGTRFGAAVFRAAFLRETEELRFVTGCALFRERWLPSRPTMEYDNVVLTEEWVKETGPALAKLKQITEGRGTICDYAIKETFASAYSQRVDSVRPLQTTGWRFTSRQSTGEQLQPWLQLPALAFGLRPYPSGYHAISDWVHDSPYAHHSPNPDVYQHEFVTIFPDARARIVSAGWLPGQLSLEISLEVPADQVEVQVLFDQASNGFLILPAQERISCEVPGDATGIWVFLVHVTGERLSQVHLYSEYEVHGTVNQPEGQERLTVDELRDGENETVEFKPWLVPNDHKEQELVATVIAFANTRGGRLYVGVDNNGSPEPETKLYRLFRSSSADAIQRAKERIRAVVREKTKPIPRIVCDVVQVRGSSVLVVAVEPGTQGPYSTQDNKVYIRKGATNRLVL